MSTTHTHKLNTQFAITSNLIMSHTNGIQLASGTLEIGRLFHLEINLFFQYYPEKKKHSLIIVLCRAARNQKAAAPFRSYDVWIG